MKKSVPPKDDIPAGPDLGAGLTEHVADLGMRLREFHHSVHNGLSLLSSSLQVQARRSSDPTVRLELGIAVSRIESLVRLHEYAYERDPARAPEASAHFTRLVQHLQTALIDPRSPRRLAFTSDSPIQLETDELVSVTSVLIELITNAIKYGKGDIRLSLRTGLASIALAIEDEGEGFPASFQLPADAGFGLRLVSRVCTCSGGSLSIDRSVPFTRVVAVIGVRG
ncbi:MAG: histidine kinase dimerization/phosphoacceptor domain -containing protein [Pigmentiphaga sp.]|uniref:histidine kinase dimerization/phosphoacceptor domain -containing protein n=1 Tax=Pigmentiphaga sp. TaxID=1977564 RepID=UPI0029B13C38|nr:histidine kinase dimerization/phosphoacceptor domain -containing protein [Pigmentiphaga sp.]MDX3906203.1 histidine kinase dimerization/phosphoacceptor domain -containing protein [Pigmentiphaga sp.]